MLQVSIPFGPWTNPWTTPLVPGQPPAPSHGSGVSGRQEKGGFGRVWLQAKSRMCVETYHGHREALEPVWGIVSSVAPHPLPASPSPRSSRLCALPHASPRNSRQSRD